MEAAREAGDIAMGYFRKQPAWRRKADNTPVSEADMAVDAALRERLLKARPDYGWLSEETEDDLTRLEKSRVWVLDPVDGTRGFLQDNPNWCVSLALVEDRRPVIGVIHAPALGLTWTAQKGRGAALNAKPIHVSQRTDLAGARIVGPRYILDPARWGAPWPKISLLRLPSLALRLARVASADAAAMAAPGHKSDWDIAAGDIIIHEAGGILTDAEGKTILYNRAETRPFGVAAANPALHQQILARLKTFKGCRKGHWPFR